MKFASLSLALCPLAAIAYPDLQSRDTQSEAYRTDLFEGTRLQEDQASLNASELTYTQQNGRPWFQPQGAQRAGSSGPLLLQDHHLIDTLATFNRERIPERVVHARGAGAHGYFEVTSDYASKYSVADVFKLGTKTSITMRFSTVGGARGSADLARDPRGFSIKMRTKKGILDWVFNSMSKSSLSARIIRLTLYRHSCFLHSRPCEVP
jgi:catalase